MLKVVKKDSKSNSYVITKVLDNNEVYVVGYIIKHPVSNLWCLFNMSNILIKTSERKKDLIKLSENIGKDK